MFKVLFDVAEKLAVIGRDDTRRHDGREMSMVQFLLLFHKDLQVALKEMWAENHGKCFWWHLGWHWIAKRTILCFTCSIGHL